MNESVQSIGRSAGWSVGRSVCRSVCRSVSLWVCRSVGRSVGVSLSDSRCVGQLVSRSIRPPVGQYILTCNNLSQSSANILLLANF